MKKMFIYILLTGFPAFFYAQTVLFTEPIPLKSDEWYQIIGKMGNRYLLFKRTLEGKFEINGFSAEMNLQWSKEVELDHKRPKILKINSTKNDFTVVYEYQAKGKTIVKAHKYDPGANLVDSTTIYNYKNSFYGTDFQVVQSEDKSKLLIYYVENQKEVFAVSFDIENMKVLWDCVFVPDALSIQRNFVQVLVTDKGQMYFIHGKDNQKTKKEEHVYDIYFGNEETASKSITFFTFPMNEKLTFDIVFTFDNLNNRIIAGGLYSENTKTKSVGYFYLSVSPENPDDYILVFEPFDDEFVSNFLGKQVEAGKGLSETVIQEIILRRDGGILMVGEQAVRNERQTIGAGSVGTSMGHIYFDYYYDDLFVISIHPSGETHWKTILHKKQYSYDDDAVFSSYFLLKTAKSLSFFFNDEVKYENTVSEYNLRGDGKYDRNSILNTKNKKLRLMFRRGMQVSANEFLVPSEYRNRFSLVSIKN